MMLRFAKLTLTYTCKVIYMNTKISLLVLVFTLLCFLPFVSNASGFIRVDHQSGLPPSYSNETCRDVAQKMRKAIGFQQAGNNWQQVGVVIQRQFLLPNTSDSYAHWIDSYVRKAIIQLFGVDTKPYQDAPQFSTIAQMSGADYEHLYKVSGWHAHTPEYNEIWAYRYCMHHPMPSQLITPDSSPKSVVTAARMTCSDMQNVIDQMIENMEPFGGLAGMSGDIDNYATTNVLSLRGQTLLDEYLQQRYHEIRNMFDRDPAASDAENENLPSEVRQKILSSMRRKIHYKELGINTNQCPAMLKQVQAYDQQRLKEIKAEEN